MTSRNRYKIVLGSVTMFLSVFILGAQTIYAANILDSDLNNNGVVDSTEVEVIVSSSKSLLAGEYNFNNLVITNNAILTLEGDQLSPALFKGVKINATNITVTPGSRISADGRGYASGSGAPFPGTSAGASYGGTGGGNTATSTYGSAMMPTDLGSGTGGYRGGGTIRLVVTGTLLINGDISANGGGYRTSGGSIYVTTNNLTGAGTLNANGGSTSWPYSFAGGGGRIAVYYQQSSFTGNAKVNAGVYCFYGCNPAGGPGTAVFIDTANSDLYVKGSFRFQANDAPFNFRNVTLENSASAEIEKDISIVADNILVRNSSGLTVKNGTTIDARILALEQNSYFTILGAPVLSIPLINVGQGSTLTLSGNETLVSDTMNIKNGGTLTVDKEHVLSLIIPNLNIFPGSFISANLKGYSTGFGQGVPATPSAGASYGGVGFWNTASSTYGSSTAPTDFGSGGNGYHTQGGGAIRLVVTNAFLNDGTVSADGGNTSSGGSIYVTADKVSGAGSYRANGGGFYCPNSCIGMGGGGRVALYYATSSFSGGVFAKGGCNSFDGWSMACAQNGTVVVKPVETKCQTNCYSNILFLPGVMGSRLYDEQGQELWASSNDLLQAKLALNPDGKSLNVVYTRDDTHNNGELDETGIVDDVYGQNIYQSFINDLRKWKNDEKIIEDYAFIPYDWRLSLEDIITNGTTTPSHNLSYNQPQSFSESYILKQLEALQKTSRNGKVTIVAHSNGGLVTKALIQKLKETNNPLYDKIDKVIFVAVPQVGTPDAIAAVLHGTSLGSGLVMSAARSRDLAKDMPTMYNLLPSAEYFKVIDPGYVVDKVVSFENKPSFSSQLSQYGMYVSNENELKGYILNDDQRSNPGYTDINSPAVGNHVLYGNAQSVHAVLDKWQPASSTKLVLVAGWGEETLAGIDNVESVSIPTLGFTTHTINIRHVVDGDGAVVEPSALWTPTSASNVEKWWVNLSEYNNFFAMNLSRDHRDILEVPNLRLLIKSKIDNSVFGDSENIVVSETSTLVSDGERLHFTLHSPLTLGITDSSGRYTGLDPLTGKIKEEIPNTTYKQYGEVQFLSVPAGLQYTLKLKGYEKGAFSLGVEKQVGNTVTESTTFQAIPTATSTVVMMDISPMFAVASSTLAIDQNADGVTDVSLDANPSGVTIYDLTTPTTTPTSAGTLGLNGYYASSVTVTLTSDDTAPPGEVSSGVASTKYSLDKGTIWNTYSTSTPLVVATEGTSTLQYYSVDNNGNRETVKTLTLNIDTVAPTIFASDVFSEQLTQSGTSLVISATAEDNIDVNPTIISSAPLAQTFAPGTTDITLTATDMAGNTSTTTITVTVFSSPEADPDGDCVVNADDVKPFDSNVFANLVIPAEYSFWEKEKFTLPFSVAGKGMAKLSLSATSYKVSENPIRNAQGIVVPSTIIEADGFISTSFQQITKELTTYTLELTTKKWNTKERDNETKHDLMKEPGKEVSFAPAPIGLSLQSLSCPNTVSQTATVNIYDKQQTAQLQYKYKDTDRTTTLLKSEDTIKIKKGQPLTLTVKVVGIKKNVPFTSNITGNFIMLNVVQEEENDHDTDRKQTKFSLFYPQSTATTNEPISITMTVNGVTQTNVVWVRFDE